MSLFKGEALPEVRAISFTPRRSPVPLNSGTTAELWFDEGQGNILGISNRQNVAPQLVVYTNAAPVSQNTFATPLVLMTAPISIPVMNASGKTLEVFAAGTYNTNAAGTPTVNLVVTLGGTNVMTWTSGATTGGQSNMPWEVQGVITLVSNGATANVEAHGSMCVTLGSSAGGSTTTYLDVNSANVGTINLQANTNVAVLGNMSVSNVNCVLTQRQMVVVLSN